MVVVDTVCGPTALLNSVVPVTSNVFSLVVPTLPLKVALPATFKASVVTVVASTVLAKLTDAVAPAAASDKVVRALAPNTTASP